jgi:HlyD family secretion protein
MKKALIILTFITLVAILFIAFGLVIGESQASQMGELETEPISRGTLSIVVQENGLLKSNQSAILYWKIPGEIKDVYVATGDQISTDDPLASLDPTTLQSYIISAQADLIKSQRALDNLLNSKIQQAKAFVALYLAEKSLDDSLHPEVLQADALVKLADALKALEATQQGYLSATTPPSQSAIDQAYSNLILAENKVAETEDTLDKLARGDTRVVANSELLSPEQVQDMRHDIRRAIKQFELVLTQDKLAYEKSLARYNALISPLDLIDMAVAEADLATASATLEEAQREWDRIKDGVSSADIAVLEADLADAQREWERIKAGPNQDDITVLQAQITAAEAAIEQKDILAPFDGTVTAVETQAHDLVDLGTRAFQIDDLSHLYVDLAVSEVDINRIEIGQKVTLTFDAIPAKEYEGEVVEIGLVGTKILGAASFRVTVEVLDAFSGSNSGDLEPRPGMTSSAQIVIDEIEDALLVPNRAIRALNGDIVVYRLEEIPGIFQIPSLRWELNSDSVGAFKFPLVFQRSLQYQLQPVAITLGATSGAYSEILAGNLQTGDIIVLNPPSE